MVAFVFFWAGSAGGLGTPDTFFFLLANAAISQRHMASPELCGTAPGRAQSLRQGSRTSAGADFVGPLSAGQELKIRLPTWDGSSPNTDVSRGSGSLFSVMRCRGLKIQTHQPDHPGCLSLQFSIESKHDPGHFAVEQLWPSLEAHCTCATGLCATDLTLKKSRSESWSRSRFCFRQRLKSELDAFRISYFAIFMTFLGLTSTESAFQGRCNSTQVV